MCSRCYINIKLFTQQYYIDLFCVVNRLLLRPTFYCSEIDILFFKLKVSTYSGHAQVKRVKTVGKCTMHGKSREVQTTLSTRKPEERRHWELQITFRKS